MPRHIERDLRQMRFVEFELRPLQMVEAQISSEQENEGNGDYLKGAAGNELRAARCVIKRVQFTRHVSRATCVSCFGIRRVSQQINRMRQRGRNRCEVFAHGFGATRQIDDQRNAT